MKKSRFTDSQIIAVLKHPDAKTGTRRLAPLLASAKSEGITGAHKRLRHHPRMRECLKFSKQTLTRSLSTPTTMPVATSP